LPSPAGPAGSPALRGASPLNFWKPWAGRIPWTFVAIAAVAAAIQVHSVWDGKAWRAFLIYDRAAVARGQLWRLWSGHLVHFGWPHFIADGGLFVILGFLLERPYPRLSRAALFVMPLIISTGLFFLEPDMQRYAGLSAVNLGFLVFLACRGWQRNWFDWFWPAVLLIYVGEVILETVYGHGRGGGMIQFDDPTTHVATLAHIVAAFCGLALWGLSQRGRSYGTR
jgi:rhomboid family GlyGly-CTERM serine protease